jgi:hypothetical protein
MPVRLHGGSIPAPGVWDVEGYGIRKAANAQIGTDMVTAEAGAGADFLYTNSYWSNGATGNECGRARELHLDVSLVPFAQAPASNAGAQRSLSLSPSKRIISGIAFDDGSQPSAAGASVSPQRVCVDGAWRLSTSLGTSASASSLSSPVPRHLGDEGKQPVPVFNERRVQLDNRKLADSRAATFVHERRTEVQDDRSRNGAWDARWGFPGRPSFEESPTRKRQDPRTFKPTLVGFAV